jgi:hypothetical protein
MVEEMRSEAKENGRGRREILVRSAGSHSLPQGRRDGRRMKPCPTRLRIFAPIFPVTPRLFISSAQNVYDWSLV